VVYLGNQHIVDAVQLSRQLLGTALGAELLHQGLGQRCKALDVGEPGRATRAVWQVFASGHSLATVYGNIDI
jgi:hypothetical protein